MFNELSVMYSMATKLIYCLFVSLQSWQEPLQDQNLMVSPLLLEKQHYASDNIVSRSTAPNDLFPNAEFPTIEVFEMEATGLFSYSWPRPTTVLMRHLTSVIGKLNETWLAQFYILYLSRVKITLYVISIHIVFFVPPMFAFSMTFISAIKKKFSVLLQPVDSAWEA